MSDRMYKVQITSHCEDVLRETAYSIAVDLAAPDAAIAWAMKMRGHIFNLAYFPSRVQLTPEEPWRSFGIRRLPVGKYYIYFLILEDLKEVRVTDVVFQGMDQAKRLAGWPVQEFLPDSNLPLQEGN